MEYSSGPWLGAARTTKQMSRFNKKVSFEGKRSDPDRAKAFDTSDIQAEIFEQVARIRSASLEWAAEPEGSLDDHTVRTLVDTLDVHAKAYLRGVREEEDVPIYLDRLRRVGAGLVHNAREGSVLKDRYSEESLGQLVKNEFKGKKSRSGTDQGSELERRVVQLDIETRGEAMRWHQWRSALLARIEVRFLARYEHWRAEALNRLRARGGGVAGASARPHQSLSWADISIRFLSDERISIRRGDRTETRNYSEMGCVDRRNELPNSVWVLLRQLAKNSGVISSAALAPTKRPAVEKQIERARVVLRKQFSLKGDPLPFVHGTGYRALFKIDCAPSSEY